MKMLKTLLITIVIIIVSLICLGLISWFLDYFFYSWTANTIRPFGCEYKYVRSPHEFRKKKLKEEYDLFEIVDQIKSNPEYKIEKERRYKGDIRSLLISRRFGDSSYRIEFDKGKYDGKRFIKINYGIFNHTQPPDAKGELSTTPNHKIRKNINRMINEMPLNMAQKKELRSRVEIGCREKVQLSF